MHLLKKKKKIHTTRAGDGVNNNNLNVKTYPTAPIAPTVAPTTEALTDALIDAPTAPTELIILVGKKLLVVELFVELSVRGESLSGGPPLPAEWGPPEPPLSSDGVLFRNSPVPKSTKLIGELSK